MAYITKYAGNEVDFILQKSNFISDSGKVPKCFEADQSITCDNANNATTTIKTTLCDSASTCINAINALTCNNYLPLTGGTVNGAITANKNYICKNYLSELNHSGSKSNIKISSAMNFDTINANEGGAWDISNNRFICPVKGIYLVVFTIYSDNTGTTGVRPGLLKNGSAICFSNGPYGHSISAAVFCEAGDYLLAGAYESNYPFTTWSDLGHNNFYVTLLLQIE